MLGHIGLAVLASGVWLVVGAIVAKVTENTRWQKRLEVYTSHLHYRNPRLGRWLERLLMLAWFGPIGLIVELVFEEDR